jgi:hypothetical protein
VPKVGVARVDLLARRRNGDPVRFGIGDRVLAAPNIPGTPGRDDRKIGSEGRVGQLEADLVISLPRASVRQRVGADLSRDLDLPPRNERTTHRRAEKVFAIVDRASAKRRIDERLDKFLAEILDEALISARRDRLGAYAGELFAALPDVACDANDPGSMVILLEPRDDDRCVEAAGIGEHDRFVHERSYEYQVMQCNCIFNRRPWRRQRAIVDELGRVRSGHSGQIEQASGDDGSGLAGPADNQNSVLAAERTDDLRPAVRIDGLGNRLGSAGQGVEDDELRDSIDAREQLG